MWVSIIFGVATLIFFSLSYGMNPGYLEQRYDYVSLIDKALENGLHLENFCSYD